MQQASGKDQRVGRGLTYMTAIRHWLSGAAWKGSEGGEGLTYMTAIRHWLSGAAWTQRLKNAMRENEAFQIMQQALGKDQRVGRG